MWGRLVASRDAGTRRKDAGEKLRAFREREKTFSPVDDPLCEEVGL